MGQLVANTHLVVTTILLAGNQFKFKLLLKTLTIDSHTWLAGRANAMHSSIDKFKDGVARKIFQRIVEEFSTIKIDSGLFFSVKLFYHCLYTETINDVKASVEGVLEVVNLIASMPKLGKHLLDNNLFNNFEKFTGMKKPLDWYEKRVVEDIDQECRQLRSQP